MTYSDHALCNWYRACSCMHQSPLQNMNGTSPVWLRCLRKRTYDHRLLYRSIHLTRIATLPAARYIRLSPYDSFMSPLLWSTSHAAWVLKQLEETQPGMGWIDESCPLSPNFFFLVSSLLGVGSLSPKISIPIMNWVPYVAFIRICPLSETPLQ